MQGPYCGFCWSAEAVVRQKGAREAHERCHEAYGDDLPREGEQGPRPGRGSARDPRLLVPEAAGAPSEGPPRSRRRGDLPQAPRAAAEPAPGTVLEARGPGPQGV